MELIKKEIHTSVLKASRYTQLTVDEDFNVPDAKSDIDKIITYKGNIIIDEIDMDEDKIKISGVLCFVLLYRAPKKENESIDELSSYSGEIIFQDVVNLDGVKRGDRGEVHSYLEDFEILPINSRKISVRGLIGNALSVYSNAEGEAVTRIENGQGIECNYKEFSLTKMDVCRKEMLRIKEEYELPRSKPNIKNIIWSSFDLRNLESRAAAEKISIRGDADIFIIYMAEEEGLPYQYLSLSREISYDIPAEDISEDMVCDILMCLGKGNVTVHPDIDGEPRNISAEYGMFAEIKGYTDEKFTFVNDMFSPNAELLLERKPLQFENLILHNSAKTRVIGKERLRGSNARILQVCSASGDVEIDNVKISDNSIIAEGVVKADVIYVTDEEDNQFASWNLSIPFEYSIDAMDVNKDASVRMTPTLDQITVQLLGIDEIEVRAVVTINLTVFKIEKEEMISGVEILPIDIEKKEKLPGIVGYIVKSGDNIWSIARTFYSSTESIRRINELDSDEIKAGDRLIIIKS